MDGRAVASGALRRRDDVTAEIKRMYVAPDVRRRGVGAAMLRWLERAAARAGYDRVVLETGNEQPEALAMYRSAGYAEVEPYGHYRCHPDAHALGRTLDGGAPSG
jgi:GNAT superfamily N-acetyltransferase